MVRWRSVLILSSIRVMVRVVVCSMSRRIVMLEEARGMRTVRIEVIIRCMIVKAGRRLKR